MLTTTTVVKSVSEWAPPLSFLVFDKLRRKGEREQRVSQLGEALLEEDLGWGTVHLGAGCTLTRRCIDAGDGSIAWQGIFCFIIPFLLRNRYCT